MIVPRYCADLLFAQAVDVGLAGFDQVHRVLVELLEVVRGEELTIAPVKPEPAYVALEGTDVLHVLGGRVGVVKAQVAGAAEVSGHAKVQADRFGVADVWIAVGLRREPRRYLATPLAGGAIGGDDRADKVRRCV